MAELHSLASKEIYGSVVEISKPEYAAQVSEASEREGIFVIVHLYDNSLPACKLINGILNVLAQKHKSVKFLRILATRCIENYPEKNIPTLLVYGNGELKGQLVGIEALGGLGTSVLRVHELLSSRQFGALPPPSKELLEKDSGFKLTRTADASIRQSANNDSDDDEDPYA